MFKRILIFSLLYYITKEELPSNGSIPLPISTIFPITSSPSKNLHNKHYYTLPLKIGTPGKIFNVQIDTSTSTSWVPSLKCNNCDYSKNKYNERESYTSSPTNEIIEIEDEDGEVEGYKIYDTVSLNDFKLNQFGFIQVFELDDDFRDTFDGKLGLGFSGEIHHDFNFIEKLNFDRIIPYRIFSIEFVNDTFGMLFIGDLTVKNYTFCNCTSNEGLDDIYKQSWLCDLSHLGFFYDNKTINKEISKLNNYNVLNKDRVEFDSAYDFIAVPKGDKNFIFDSFKKIGLNCYTNADNDIEGRKKNNLPKPFEDEISIYCDKKEISDNILLTFVLQGFGYNVQLNKLFYNSNTYKNTLESLIKIIDDDDAIWTLGYPFFQNYLMIFNMEEKHVGIYSNNKKVTSKIINLQSDWNFWYDNGGKNSLYNNNVNQTFLMIATIFLCCLLALIIICFLYRLINRRKFKDTNSIIEIDNLAREKIY